VSLLVIFFQMAFFAFAPYLDRESTAIDHLQKFLDKVIYIGIDSGDVRYTHYIWLVWGVVVLFVAIFCSSWFIKQEVFFEKMRAGKARRCCSKLWDPTLAVVKFLCLMVALPGFLPLFTLLIATFDCTYEEWCGETECYGVYLLDAESDLCESTLNQTLNGTAAFYDSCTKCFSDGGAAARGREALSGTLIVLLFYCSYRLLRVGGKLERVNLNNPWLKRYWCTCSINSVEFTHMSLDSDAEAVRRHPFSYSDAGYLFEKRIVICKAALATAVVIFGDNYQQLVVVLVAIVGVCMLLILIRFPPYSDQRWNFFIFFMMFVLALLYIVAMVEVLFENQVATIGAIGISSFLYILVVLWFWNQFGARRLWPARNKRTNRVYPEHEKCSNATPSP